MDAYKGFTRKPTDYLGKIEDSRMTDDEGDLGYTIHINRAKTICQELEKHYLLEMIKMQKKIKRWVLNKK